jgi:hypothetical protein
MGVYLKKKEEPGRDGPDFPNLISHPQIHSPAIVGGFQENSFQSDNLIPPEGFTA